MRNIHVIRQGLKILMFWLPFFATAQQNPVDSMYNDLVHAHTDSAKYQAYVGLYFYHSESNPDSAMYFADKMVQLAGNNEKQPDEIISLSFMGYQLYRKNRWGDSYKILLEAFRLADVAEDDPDPWFYGYQPVKIQQRKMHWPACILYMVICPGLSVTRVS